MALCVEEQSAARRALGSARRRRAVVLALDREHRSYRAMPPVPTQRGARTLALDPRTHRVFTATAQFGEPAVPTPKRPRPRPPMVPGTFGVRVLDPSGKTGAN